MISPNYTALQPRKLQLTNQFNSQLTNQTNSQLHRRSSSEVGNRRVLPVMPSYGWFQLRTAYWKEPYTERESVVVGSRRVRSFLFSSGKITSTIRAVESDYRIPSFLARVQLLSNFINRGICVLSKQMTIAFVPKGPHLLGQGCNIVRNQFYSVQIAATANFCMSVSLASCLRCLIFFSNLICLGLFLEEPQEPAPHKL